MKIKNVSINFIALILSVISLNAFAYPIVYSKDIYVTNNGHSLTWNYVETVNSCIANPWSGAVQKDSSKTQIATVNCLNNSEGWLTFMQKNNQIEGFVQVGIGPCTVLSTSPGFQITATPGNGSCKIVISNS